MNGLGFANVDESFFTLADVSFLSGAISHPPHERCEREHHSLNEEGKFLGCHALPSSS